MKKFSFSFLESALKIATPVALLFLAGCQVLSYFTPRPFDANEYGEVVSITQYATRTVHQCGDRKDPLFKTFLGELNTHSMYLAEYTQNKLNNSEAALPAGQIRALVLQFDSRAISSSLKYCQHKLSNIQNAARTSARALGRVSAYNFCEADLISLHDQLLKDRQGPGGLVDDEYKELAEDLVILGKVNLSACDLRHRAQIEEAISVISKAASLAAL